MSQKQMWCGLLGAAPVAPAQRAKAREKCFGTAARFYHVRKWVGRGSVEYRYTCPHHKGREKFTATFTLRRTPDLTVGQTGAMPASPPADPAARALWKQTRNSVLTNRNPESGVTDSPEEASWYVAHGHFTDAYHVTNTSTVGDPPHEAHRTVTTAGDGETTIPASNRLVFNLKRRTWSLYIDIPESRKFTLSSTTTDSPGGSTTETEQDAFQQLKLGTDADGDAWPAAFYKLPKKGLTLNGHGERKIGPCTSESVSWHIAVARHTAIDIYRDGAPVTNETLAAIVGEPIVLLGDADTGGKPVLKRRWSIEGEPIKTWKVATSTKTVGTGNNTRTKTIYPSAHVENLKPVDYTKRSITFYWWKPGIYSVRYRVRTAGKVYAAETRFKVKRPRIAMKAVTPDGPSGVVISKGGTGIYAKAIPQIEYAGNGHTINFYRSALPKGFPGDTEFLQLTRGTLVERRRENIALHPFCLISPARNRNEYGLDTDYPYGVVNAKKVWDTPGTVIDYVDKSVKTHDYFRMYLMYRPAKRNAIFVPIRYVDWWVKGHMEYHDKVVDPGWHDAYLKHVSGAAYRSKNPISHRARSYPTWSYINGSGKLKLDSCEKSP